MCSASTPMLALMTLGTYPLATSALLPLLMTLEGLRDENLDNPMEAEWSGAGT